LCFWILSIILLLFKTHNVSETGFCIYLQGEHTQLGQIVFQKHNNTSLFNAQHTEHFRGRINIGGGPRPLRPGPKINIGGRPRPGAAPASAATTQAAPTEPDQEGNEQASHPTTADDTQSEAQEVSNTDIILKNYFMSNFHPALSWQMPYLKNVCI
jgi:hypothetical protein